MCRIVPLIVDPDRVILLETITSIWLGSVAGGAELFPVRVVHVAPQLTAVGLSANPFIEDGAVPPLKTLFAAHCAPQKFTVLPMVGFPADTLPMTKAPVAGGANTVTLEETLAGR